MGVEAPERATGRSTVEINLAPPGPRGPGQVLVHGRVQRLRRRRQRVVYRILLSLVVVVLLVTGAVVLASRPGTHRTPAAVLGGPPPASLAWAVRQGSEVFVTVIGLPGGERAQPVAMVVPPDTAVDVPGAALTVGELSTSPGLFVAGVQAALGSRVGHWLSSDVADLRAVVDRLGGVDVQVEEPFSAGGRTIEPGLGHLSGEAVLAYLASGSPIDRDGRWGEVLAGLFSASVRPQPWRTNLGRSDDLLVASTLMSRAHGAAVLELPTAPAPGGGPGLAPDMEALGRIEKTRFGGSLGPLARVVVLNGNGRPAMGAAVASILSPAGFRVVASQNATRFDVDRTAVVASTTDFLQRAQEAAKLLAVGKVYVGRVPSGIADLTIVVGKDFQPG